MPLVLVVLVLVLLRLHEYAKQGMAAGSHYGRSRLASATIIMRIRSDFARQYLQHSSRHSQGESEACAPTAIMH